jgi:hypothetical protein
MLMDTTNPAVTKTWAKHVDDGEDFCASSEFPQFIEYAPHGSTPAATLSGHKLRDGMAASRLAFPTGDIWVRIDPSSNLASATIKLSK